MSAPNLQQVGKLATRCEACKGEGCDECGGSGEDLHSVRRCFGPAEGREWWSGDAGNIELRLPAWESGERELIALFERPDDPPFYGSQHMLNMSIVYDDVWADAVKRKGLERAAAFCKSEYAKSYYYFVKCGGLAMQYQAGEATADRTFRRKGGYNRLKAHFRAVDALNRRWVTFAAKHGFVETMPENGAAHGYPLLVRRSFNGGIVPTVPLNYRVQGTAGRWMRRAMVRCEDLMEVWRATRFDAWMVLTVHDELIWDLPRRADPRTNPKASNLARARKLQAAMESCGRDIGVPTPVNLEYHPDNWAEGVPC
jgi:DNA polymerase I-like protein with 3'-5' exonuclease and polymerase domains